MYTSLHQCENNCECENDCENTLSYVETIVKYSLVQDVKGVSLEPCKDQAKTGNHIERCDYKGETSNHIK